MLIDICSSIGLDVCFQQHFNNMTLGFSKSSLCGFDLALLCTAE